MNIIFVYNAKSNLIDAGIDLVHKIVSPSTYACDLCSLTHGIFGERKAWGEFVKTSNVDMTFYHIDEFEKRFEERFDYPVILEDDRGEINLLAGRRDIGEINDLNELIQIMSKIISR